MTKWFSPQAAGAGQPTATPSHASSASSPIGARTQHLADPIPADAELRKKFAFRYDYATGAGDGAFWVDFVADIGRRLRSHLRHRLSGGSRQALRQAGPAKDGIAGIKGLPAGQELPHGRLLLLGGDQVYPVADAGGLRPAHLQALRAGAARAAGRPATAPFRPPAGTCSPFPATTTGTTASTPSTTSSAAAAPPVLAPGACASATSRPASIAAPLRSSCRTTGGSGVPTSSSPILLDSGQLDYFMAVAELHGARATSSCS